MLDLPLGDSDGLLDIPNRGARLRVAIGWKGQPLVDKGVYTVDEIERIVTTDYLVVRTDAELVKKGHVISFYLPYIERYILSFDSSAKEIRSKDALGILENS